MLRSSCGHGFEVEIHALRTAPNGVNDFRGLTRRPVRRVGTKVVHGTEQFALSLLTSRVGSPENVVSNYLSTKNAVFVHFSLVDRTSQHVGATRPQVP